MLIKYILYAVIRHFLKPCWKRRLLWRFCCCMSVHLLQRGEHWVGKQLKKAMKPRVLKLKASGMAEIKLKNICLF